MYEGLSDKSVIKQDAAVVDIIDSEDSVKVVLADGSTEEGDLVLGVDGVHSRMRSLMWRNANTAVPGMISANEKKSKYYPMIRYNGKLTSDVFEKACTPIILFCWASARPKRR